MIFANESVYFRKVYDFAVAHDMGRWRRDAERLEDMEQIDDAGQRAHIGLSNQSRFVYAKRKARTPNLQYVAPEVMCEGGLLGFRAVRGVRAIDSIKSQVN